MAKLPFHLKMLISNSLPDAVPPKIEKAETPEALAVRIRAAAKALNAAIADGVAAGLDSELDLLCRETIGKPDSQIVIVRSIGKLL